MVATGFVSSGDIVMLDNAPIHVAGDTLGGMHALCGSTGARIVFQPKYSPD